MNQMIHPNLPADALELEARTDLVARARALQPLLRKNAARTEQDRRVVEENIQALQASGLFKLMVPKRYGGHEANLRTSLDVVSTIAEACGSTAWAMNLISINAWAISIMSRRTQDEVFGQDADARCAGVLSPNGTTRRVEGGLVLSGKWYFASGSLHSTWAMLGALETNGAGDPIAQYMALVPMSDLAIEDTWFTVGMRGSGSNCLVGNDVFVPEHRLLPVGPALAGNYLTEYKDEAVYRAAFAPIATLVLAGPQLGLARAALKHVIDSAPKRAIAYTTYARQSDSTAFQLQVADAAMKIDAAHLVAFRCADAIDGCARSGQPMDWLTRARCRADTSFAAQQVVDALQILVTAHGAGTFAEANPLQRIWRDSNAAARHAIVLPPVGMEIYGKALLGVEPNISPII